MDISKTSSRFLKWCRPSLPLTETITYRSASPPAGPQPTSLSTAFLHLIATLISSSIVVGMMCFIAADSDGGGGDAYIPDPNTCGCDCFDRRFKGEHFSSTKQYRHVYFNMTTNTALLFLWSSMHLALLLSLVDRALRCLYSTLCHSYFPHSTKGPGHLRWRVLILLSINLYGLIYGWWVMFNYINDARHWSKMGVLWPTQLFFSLTDLLPAYIGYSLLSTGPTPPPHILVRAALSVSISHIFLALWDQGATHIRTGNALVYRDMMFLASDVAGVLLAAPFAELKYNKSGVRMIGVNVLLLFVFYQVLKLYVGGH